MVVGVIHGKDLMLKISQQDTTLFMKHYAINTVRRTLFLNKGLPTNENGTYDQENAPQIDKALAAANNADVIIACIGENSYCETPGNLTDLWLSENQRNLVKDLAKTGKPIILVLNEGRPRLVADIETIGKGYCGYSPPW
jgi:beta-glucosidase